MEAGRRYYLEAIFKGDGAPNHGAVGWQLPDGTRERPIPAARFRGELAHLRSSVAGLLEVEGTPASPYVLEQSGDLVRWLPVLTNRAPFSYEVPAEPPVPAKFFRAVTER